MEASEDFKSGFNGPIINLSRKPFWPIRPWVDSNRGVIGCLDVAFAVHVPMMQRLPWKKAGYRTSSKEERRRDPVVPLASMHSYL